MSLATAYATTVIPFAYQVQITLGALAVNQTIGLRFDAQSDFELRYIMGSSSADLAGDVMPNNFTVQINDGSSKNFLSNGFVPQRILCGPANGSIILPRFVRFPARAQFQFTFNNLVNATNVVTLELHGSKILRPEQVPSNNYSTQIVPFWYIMPPQALTALQTNGLGQIQLGTEPRFELWKIWGMSTIDADTDFMPNNFAARIEHIESGQLLTQNFSPQRLLCGPSNRKDLDPRAVSYPGQTSFKIDLQELSNNAATISVVFQGYKFDDPNLA